MALVESELRVQLLNGLAIPACPLPLHADRSWAPNYQRALTRYYAAAGAGGLAVGVHSTQFAIRDPSIGLLEPVLNQVSDELDRLGSSMLKIAGVCGATRQALREASLARDLGYHAGLISLTALRNATLPQLVEHCRLVAETIPLFGFYLQPAVGGQVLPLEFWRQFVMIPNVVAIKVAPFNRYQTLDVMRAVVESGRDDVALYTGNDDNLVADLLTPYHGWVNGRKQIRFFDGGLLGQWAVWTQRAVQLLEQIKSVRRCQELDRRWLQENVIWTDLNAAIFDAANGFSGCIPGIMEMLSRAGLAPGNRCLDPDEQLSPGQAEELDRVTACYPQLNDGEFVAQHLALWLAD